MSEDRELLKALQRGENAAWRRAYLKYKDDLFTVAQSLVCDVDTAEDCLQEVFVSLALDGYRIRGNLKRYLLSCVVNRARDHLRSRYAQSNCQVNMKSRIRTKRPDVSNPANVLAINDQMQKVTRALEKLPLEQREVIVLRLQGEMKFRQIASILDVSINTAQSRYRYGMTKLRQLLTNKEAI
ncbi:MAG: sigma-70 family RNA polymerase sigma factor [Phycisphaerales bacterium]|nr:MAG: sigma-70 family RNA polymerase sigma factor [Phycisphaerales bacterium]